MYKYIKTSFRRELLFSFILIAVLPLIISSFFMIRIFRLQLETAEHKEIKSQYMAIESSLVDYFQRIYQLSQDIVEDNTIIKNLNVEDEDTRIQTHQKLSTLVSDSRKYAQFEIYTKEGRCKFSTSTSALDTMLPTYWGVLKEAEDKPDTFVMQKVSEYPGSTSNMRMRIAKMISDEKGEKIGYIVIGLKESTFRNLLDDAFNLKGYIEITDRNFNTIYNEGSKDEKAFSKILKERLIKGEDVNQLAKEHNLNIYPIDNTELYLILQKEIFFTADISKTIYNVVTVMIIFSLILSVVVSFKLSKALFKPIHIITGAIHKIEEGDLDTRIEIDRLDEFGKLAINFNNMVDKLKDHMDSKVRQQRELNESNIKMMQAQLNPHFIYNTLDTIKWIAKENGVKEIVKLVTRLAKILRSSISSNQLTTLKHELNIVQNYMEIQQLRFNDKFKFSVDIKKSMEDYIVPKLSIQPLVENAIIHGLADREQGHIHISAHKEDDALIIQVIDDGCGIDMETMDALNSKIERRNISGIGLYNIDKIIKLRYGDEHGLLFSTRENGGTIVTIVLPITLQEENYD